MGYNFLYGMNIDRKEDLNLTIRATKIKLDGSDSDNRDQRLKLEMRYSPDVHGYHGQRTEILTWTWTMKKLPFQGSSPYHGIKWKSSWSLNIEGKQMMSFFRKF